jgi:tetratricopeptide (TPR) repeat protein
MRKLIIVLPLFLIGCFPASDLTEQGWQQYESGDVTSALSSFTDATSNDPYYADAYNGLGWCYLDQNNLSQAKNGFEQCLSLTDTIIDPYAGLALALSDLPDDAGAIANADSLLSRDPTYSFSHRSSITVEDVHLAKAKSCCNLGRFDDALTEIQYFEPNFSADPGTSLGQRAILEKLEELLSLQ